MIGKHFVANTSKAMIIPTQWLKQVTLGSQVSPEKLFLTTNKLEQVRFDNVKKLVENTPQKIRFPFRKINVLQ